MAMRENIKIKTKYKSILECEQSCVDGIGRKIVAKSWSKKLYGIFEDGHRVVISSDAKGAALFEFEGRIVAREDGIYLEGDIREKSYSKGLVYGSVAFSLILGFAMMSTFNPVFVFMGVMFMVIPWTNVIYMRKSDVLYQMLVKRVS